MACNGPTNITNPGLKCIFIRLKTYINFAEYCVHTFAKLDASKILLDKLYSIASTGSSGALIAVSGSGASNTTSQILGYVVAVAVITYQLLNTLFYNTWGDVHELYIYSCSVKEALRIQYLDLDLWMQSSENMKVGNEQGMHQKAVQVASEIDKIIVKSAGQNQRRNLYTSTLRERYLAQIECAETREVEARILIQMWDSCNDDSSGQETTRLSSEGPSHII